MEKSQLSRRSFIKLLSLTPLLEVNSNTLSVVDELESTSNLDKPNFLIIVLDALSARHMSLYGYGRYTTPNINRMAEKVTVFNRHYSAGNFTLPGTASMLTGTYPWTHRGLHLYGTVLDTFLSQNIFSLFRDDYHNLTYTHNAVVTLLLQQFIDHIDQYIYSEELGILSDLQTEKYFSEDFLVSFWSEKLRRGYYFTPSSLFYALIDSARQGRQAKILDHYADDFPRGLPNNGNWLYFLLEEVIDWLIAQVDRFSSPYFGYFHLYPPHDPYTPRREFVNLFDDGMRQSPKPPHFFSQGHNQEYLEERRQYYDEYIAYADAEIGRLYAYLDGKGLLENTYFILTSDHGEMFERGILGHDNQTLYEPIIQIPLLILRPGQRRRLDVHTPTTNIDLLPTLLSLIGKQIPAWCEGLILPTFGGSEETTDRSIYAFEAKSNSKWSTLTIGTAALIKDQYKLIHYFGYEGYEDEYELYDLDNDPDELVNLYSSSDSVAVSLKDEFLCKLRQANSNNR